MITSDDMTPEEREEERQNKIARVKMIMEDRGLKEIDAQMVEDIGFHAVEECFAALHRVLDLAPVALKPYVVQHALRMAGQNMQDSWEINEAIMAQDDCTCWRCRLRRVLMKNPSRETMQ